MGSSHGGVNRSWVRVTVGSIDRGFESRCGQTKDYKIDICCFSTKHVSYMLVGSESGVCFRVERHVYPQTEVRIVLSVFV